MKKCKVAIVGLGHQAIDDHIPAVLESPYHELSSVCDIDEEQFSSYHDVEYAVLSNSGTNAIFSMFEGISLSPDDEIICPVYTFFATISPIVYTGAKVIFCDCLKDGNISPKEIGKFLTRLKQLL